MILVLLVVISFAIISIWGYSLFSDINTDVQANDDLSTSSKTNIQNMKTSYSSLFDNLLMLIFVLFAAGLIISVFLIDSHPIFFALNIVILLAVFVVVGFMGNAYDDLMQDDTVSSYANEFVYTTWLMSNILEIFIGLGFIVVIALFIKIK